LIFTSTCQKINALRLVSQQQCWIVTTSFGEGNYHE
jgi:hypothetical protein